MTKKVSVPILTYHGLFSDPTEISGRSIEETYYWLPVREFEQQVQEMDRRGFTAIPISAILPGAPPIHVERPLVVTFDDGWKSDLRLALPILRNVGWRSEHFITVGWSGKPGFLSWEDLKEIDRAGGGIHSHTMTHQDLDRLPEDKARLELGESKRALEEQLGSSVEFLSLPGGTGARPAIVEMAKSLGYRGICTSLVGLNRPGEKVFRLRRFTITRDIPRERILAWLDGIGVNRMRIRLGALRILRRMMGRRLYVRIKERILESRG